MSDRVNTPKWKTDHTRVYGDGKSYNCTNIVTATELCNTLNEYERCTTEYREIEQKLDRIQKTVISLQMSCSIMTEELKRLHEETL